MMVGHATDNVPDTYRLLNLESKNIIKSRNVKWLDRTYGEYLRREIHESNNDDELFTDHSETDTEDTSTS